MSLSDSADHIDYASKKKVAISHMTRANKARLPEV